MVKVLHHRKQKLKTSFLHKIGWNNESQNQAVAEPCTLFVPHTG